tara:strand:+ start:2122 stop:6402 length:4281 start_codon:yes stop_codon:yes gene_type:complete
MSSSQTQVFECSRGNAQVKITNNEWINEFSEGIKIEKGDQVKLMGSFIQERGAGDQIEISKDEVATIGYTPYIKFESIKFTTPKSQGQVKKNVEYQFKMGDFSEPVMWTDSYGVEPPYTPGPKYGDAAGPGGQGGGSGRDRIVINQAQITQQTNPYPRETASQSYNDNTVTAPYELQSFNTNVPKFATTKEVASPSMTNGNYMGHYAQGESAQLVGWNEKAAAETAKYYSELSIPREFYISSLCKLVVSPICAGIRFRSDSVTSPYMIVDDNPLNTIEAGDTVASYYMSGYTGYDQHERSSNSGLGPNDYGGEIISETTAFNYGRPRYEAGPQSVVGRILAKKRVDNDGDPENEMVSWMNYTDCFPESKTSQGDLGGAAFLMGVEYYYIWEFVNPGQVKHKNDATTEDMRGQPKNAAELSPRQGSCQNDNGFNEYPFLNNLNGFPYYPCTGWANNEYQADIPGPQQDPLAFEANANNYRTDMRAITFGQPMTAGETNFINPQDSARGVTQDLGGGWQYAHGGTPAEGLKIAQDQLIGTSNSGLGFLWAGRGNSWFQQNTEQFPGRNAPAVVPRMFSSWLSAEDSIQEPIIRPYDYWWVPQSYTTDSFTGVAGSSTQQLYINNMGTAGEQWAGMGIHNFINIAGIFKVNITNDNIAPYELPPIQTEPDANGIYGKIPKFILPMTIQGGYFGGGKSNYTTANYTNNPDLSTASGDTNKGDGVFNFGVRCPRFVPHQNEKDSPTNKCMPWAIGFNVMSATPDYWRWGPDNVNTQGWFLQNAGNDALCSIHPQAPLTGNMWSADNLDVGYEAAWKQDLIVIKQQKMEVKVRRGYYTPTELAQEINRQLHYNNNDYNTYVGGRTNGGYGTKAFTTFPSVIKGNFVQTYLPDITYGFIPVTTAEQSAKLGIPMNTNVITITQDGDPDNGVDVSLVNSCVLYQMPFNAFYDETPGTPAHYTKLDNIENTLFKLIGGSLNRPYESTTTQPRFSNDAYHNFATPVFTPPESGVFLFNQKRRTMGFRPMLSPGIDETDPQWAALKYGDFMSALFYNTRLASNKFSYGGSAKIWCGATDPTFSWDNDRQKFFFSFLYTPYRPAETEKSNDPDDTVSDFSAGDAIPSAIINQTDVGNSVGSIGGIYINDLACAPITKANETGGALTVNFPTDDSFYSVSNTTNPQYIATGTLLWTELGYDTVDQIEKWRVGGGAVVGVDPRGVGPDGYGPPVAMEIYSKIDASRIYSHILRNEPKLDIAINGTNPFKSYCSMVAPYQQFLTQIDSDEVVGFNNPSRSSSAFYLIGSDFPTKHYHGSQGTKLPVIGICGRNFARFNFVFDLSESAIVWTCEEDTTITSIRTRIMTNDYRDALNLNGNSSVIYVLTKANWAPGVDQVTLTQVAQEEIAEKEKGLIPPPVASFIYPPQIYHAPMFDDTDSD